jgi:hypothetical protein
MFRDKRGNRTQEVVGSIPISSTTRFASRSRICEACPEERSNEWIVGRRIRST